MTAEYASPTGMAGDLLALEAEAWNAVSAGQAAAYYGRVLAENAVLLLFDASLNREQALAMWAENEPSWRNYRLSEMKTMPLTDEIVAVTYLVTATYDRHIEPYRARCTSVYVSKKSAWRLAFHQQAVLPTVFHSLGIARD